MLSQWLHPILVPISVPEVVCDERKGNCLAKLDDEAKLDLGDRLLVFLHNSVQGVDLCLATL